MPYCSLCVVRVQGVGTGLSQSQTGPLAGEWRLSEALFWFRKTASELSFWGGVGNAASIPQTH